MVPASLGGMSLALWVRIFYTSTMLMFLWLAGNKMFSLFLVRAPVKNGNPLTSESKDPNGSLLVGLRSKKLPIKVSVPLCSCLFKADNRSVLPCGS